MNTYEMRRALKTRRETHELRRDSILDLLGVYAPMLAPLVPAGLMAASIWQIFPELLGIEQWAAGAIALVVVVVTEVLALISTETYLEMRAHNQSHGETEHRAPAFYAGLVVGLYCVLVLVLVVVLKMFPSWAIWSLIPLSMMGVLTSWIVMLRKGFEDTKLNLAEIAERDQTERDQSATIDDLRAEIENLNSALRNEIEQRKDAESEAQRLAAQVATIKAQATVGANPSPSPLDDPHAAAEQSATVRKLNRDDRQRKLAEWLLANYAGSAMDAVPRNAIMDEFGIGRDTALADLRAVWEAQNWNGHIPTPAAA